MKDGGHVTEFGFTITGLVVGLTVQDGTTSLA